jgi:lysophospholipase L1-like esterase
MSESAYPSVTLHNVAELTAPHWTDGGSHLHRVPTDVGEQLNDGAQERVQHPSNAEVRLVPEREGETVTVTLSAPEEAVVRPFWGDFQSGDPVTVGPEPTPVEVGVPPQLRDLTADAADSGAFDPRVCRLQFALGPAVALHDVDGACRPPREDETPSLRYLAYGTSITEGANASASHLTYVAQTARHLGADPLNLGTAGSAYVENAMADHVAGRDDWDVATLALSVNMEAAGFDVAEFRERAAYMVDTVAGADPSRPVVCVTLFPYFADATGDGDGERAAAYRRTLREVVGESDHENLHLVEGREAMDVTGLTTDVIHPGDYGMGAIARHLAGVVDDLLD